MHDLRNDRGHLLSKIIISLLCASSFATFFYFYTSYDMYSRQSTDACNCLISAITHIGIVVSFIYLVLLIFIRSVLQL